jgi:hypothetical protein
MTSAELKTIRESLGLPVAWIAKQSRVQERTVRYWEAGKMRVPADVAQMLVGIDARFDIIVGETVEQVTETRHRKDLHDPGKEMSVVLIRYLSDGDLWHYQTDFRPLPATAHAALLERLRRKLLGEDIAVTIMYMIPAEYEKWRKEKGMADSQSTRSLWGAEQAAADAGGVA